MSVTVNCVSFFTNCGANGNRYAYRQYQAFFKRYQTECLVY
ncbi:hypothetical protein [Mannheimia haemolytica]|uniref:Uncharacterized protein n=1 Tax=Mannheimia haemolytica TaxID=75985 RepID=A0A378PUY6_MANHA|nr:hypothetical protein [Mannheimia haemolytica]STY91743.1 Uncharacterised protein [Mannheimia haemolytica]